MRVVAGKIANLTPGADSPEKRLWMAAGYDRKYLKKLIYRHFPVIIRASG
jgi:hypothetical protein